MTEKTDRLAREVLELNRGGMTLEFIASLHGFTKQRASQLRLRGLELEVAPEKGIWYELSPRTRNALESWGCKRSPRSIGRFFDYNLNELKRVPSIGVKCIKELNEWLIRHGEEPLT